MRKDKSLIDLVRMIAKRSTCNIQVGAIIFDRKGIFAWGWNSAGPTGMGLCAERHAIKRCNLDRINNSYILVLSLRKNRIITSRPCKKCQSVIDKFGLVVIYYENGLWKFGNNFVVNLDYFWR